MNRSTTMKTLIVGMLVVFVLPLLAFPLSVAAPTEMGGSCHGHHKPTPAPSHNCCYARPQPPAQVQVVPFVSPLQVINEFAVPHEVQTSDFVFVEPSDADLSPPPQLIRRI